MTVIYKIIVLIFMSKQTAIRLYGGSPIGFFNPAIPTKIFSQSPNPDGLYRPIPIPIIQFCLRSFPKPRRAFPAGDNFLNQHWSVDFYSYRQAWVYLFSPKWWRSFQSFARITHESHGSDFLSLNSITDKRIGTGRSVSKKRKTISTSVWKTKGHGNPVVP